MDMNVMDIINDVLLSYGDEPDRNSHINEHERAFLTREARIIKTISQSEGYAWQGDIGAALEWSPATMSRTLSDMEENDRVRRYQVGRRKLVCLPGEEPDCLRPTVDMHGEGTKAPAKRGNRPLATN